MTLRASIRRILEDDFTEADVKAVLLDARQYGNYPYLKEAGDMAAHPARDRGLVFEGLLFNYAQTCLYGHTTGGWPFPSDGTCPWWLKFWMLKTIDRLSDVEIQNRFKRPKDSVTTDVFSIFPSSKFPVRFKERFGYFEEYILQNLWGQMFSDPVFDYTALRTEIDSYIRKTIGNEPDRDVTSDLCACFCVLFHKAEFNLKRKIFGHQEIHIEKSASNLRQRHGKLALYGIVPLDWKQTKISFAFPTLVTEIETQEFISDDIFLREDDSYRLNNELDLQFRSNNRPAIRAA